MYSEEINVIFNFKDLYNDFIIIDNQYKFKYIKPYFVIFIGINNK